MTVLSIVFGVLLGFMLFRVFTAKTTEKRRDWLAVIAITTAFCLIVSGGVWAINAVTTSQPQETTSANAKPDSTPMPQKTASDQTARPTKNPEQRPDPTPDYPQPYPTKDPSEMPDPPVGGGKTVDEGTYVPVREDLVSPPTVIPEPPIIVLHPDIADDPPATSDFNPDSI